MESEAHRLIATWGSANVERLGALARDVQALFGAIEFHAASGETSSLRPIEEAAATTATTSAALDNVEPSGDPEFDTRMADLLDHVGKCCRLCERASRDAGTDGAALVMEARREGEQAVSTLGAIFDRMTAAGFSLAP